MRKVTLYSVHHLLFLLKADVCEKEGMVVVFGINKGLPQECTGSCRVVASQDGVLRRQRGETSESGDESCRR